MKLVVKNDRLRKCRFVECKCDCVKHCMMMKLDYMSEEDFFVLVFLFVGCKF